MNRDAQAVAHEIESEILAFHKAGKHAESMEALTKAKGILGIK